MINLEESKTALFRLLLGPAALALLTGCEAPGAPGSPATAPGGAVTFACADGTTLVTRFEADRDALAVVIPGRAQRRLPQVAAASGAKFSDGNVTFWNKGGEAQWIVADRPPVSCRAAT